MSQNLKFALQVSFVQSALLTTYVGLVAWFMTRADKPGFMRGNPTLGITVFLLLFVFSALISASIMLGYPAMLFFEGKKKQVIQIVGLSAAWLLVFLAVGLMLAVWL